MNRYATIDIGSNSILLLIGEVTPQGSLNVVIDIGKTTRLGRGLQEGGALNPHSVEQSIAVLKGFVALYHQEGVKEIAAVATNALRVARDADEFLSRVQKECHIFPRIIDGHEEARLSYRAVQRDPVMPPDAVVIDVGGGSTEYIIPSNPLKTISLALGAVRLTEEFLTTDPPSTDEIERLQGEIKQTLNFLPVTKVNGLVSIGGTGVALGTIHRDLKEFDAKKIHGMQLSREEISAIIEKLVSVDLESRRKIRGLPPDRADILPAGAMIILATMEHFAQETIHISCHGMRYGLFYERFMGAD